MLNRYVARIATRQYQPLIITSALLIGAVYALGTYFRIGIRGGTQLLLLDFLFGLSLTLGVWWYNLVAFPWIERRILLDQRSRGRRVLQSLSTLVVTLLLVQLGDTLPEFAPEWKDFNEPRMADELKGSVVAVVVLLMLFLFETMARFYRTMLENEHLKLENSVAQFETLKQQISPHFLFNSLNILKTLIANHDEKAEAYLIRLSEFYRSLLVYNKHDKIPLADELIALDHYLYLLHIRFEGKFECRLNIPAAVRQTMIPPFTLQMLVENGLKHNVASAEKPLLVEIFVEHNYLVVRNNLQPKRTVDTSSHIGLENISRRYILLAGADVEIERTTAYFTVRLPIFK